MTFRDAQRAAYEQGYVLSRDHGSGEFRLAPLMRDRQRAERLAYYTDDLDDAVRTLSQQRAA